MAGCRRKAPTTRQRLGKRLVWIVDPIDGTRAYLAGREDWCVSVALVEDALPVLAAVFAPASDEFFFAERGRGCDAQRRADSCDDAARNSIFLASPVRSQWSSGSIARLEKLRCIRGSDRWRFGCAGSREGRLDAAFAGGQSRDWDLAAANLIVQEANGSMTALSGDAILYNRREVTHGVLVAAGRDRHASIVEQFRARPLP